MASFTFGSTSATTPTPAAPGAFSFGSTAPAGGGGFSFGASSSTTTGQAPSSSGFSFGAPTSTSTTTFAFGAPSSGTNAPAPNTGGFSFGAPSTNAPAPGGGGLFGSTTSSTGQPAPAPFGFSFSSAPSSGGNPAPAPFSFASSAPAGGIGSGFSFAQPGGTTPTAGGATATPTGNNAVITGRTPYSALPPEYQRAIDAIHEAMMKHKRTMIHVQAMGPQALMMQSEDDSLPSKLKKLQQSLNVTQQNVERLRAIAIDQREKDRKVMEQSYMYAKWPTEAMAARRGVRLSSLSEQEEKKESDPDMRAQLREMLERQMAYVDRIERMPSPYLWQTLDDMSHKIKALSDYIANVDRQLEYSKSLESSDVVNLETIVDNQDQFIYAIRSRIQRIHRAVDKLRVTYTAFETGENVLEKAQMEEWNHAKEIEEQIQMQLLRSAESSSSGNPTSINSSSTNATSSAPLAFGATPSAAPSSSFSFGGGGSSAAPAPTFGGGGSMTTPSFGASKPATNPPIPKKKSSSRSSSRTRR
ncbi:hypothetical protein ACA910_012607 [Epithemia clementina (nom. ined.)]